MAEHDAPEFVRIVIRCGDCFDEWPFWGNAEVAETLARSFIRKHINCGHVFNLPSVEKINPRSGESDGRNLDAVMNEPLNEWKVPHD